MRFVEGMCILVVIDLCSYWHGSGSSFLTLPVSWLIGVPCLVHDICYSFSGHG